ncbi:MAG: TonB-dependent receptor [Bacteroidales bacterium]|nr:TonB-dependent receptor [Bacteroidales bacterium]
MRLVAILFFAFGWLTHGAVSAQATVGGRVTDRLTGEPLPDVYVIYGRGLGTTTDTDGFYTFATSPGSFRVEFKYIGYKSHSETVTLEEGETLELNAVMEPEAQLLDQIVVSADRMEQKRSELTVSMDVIKPEYLFRTHITDAQELITKNSGIEVLDGQASVRGGSGFSYGVGSRVLALVDGLPMMSADAGNIKWQFLPLENLSQVEIIKGASSVLYGSSALNGVINFRTADASNVPLTTFYTEGGIYGAPRNRDWKWWDTPRIFGSASFSHLRKIGNTDLGIAFYLAPDNGYRKYNDETMGRISLRLKHHSGRVEGLKYGVSLSGGKTYKADFILWEDAEYGALKQDTSTVSRLHGSFFAADPFISLSRNGRMKHDIRMRLLSSANRFPVRVENNSAAFSVYGEYQFWYRFSDHFSMTAGFAETWSSVTSNFFGDHRALNLAGFAQLEAGLLDRLKVTAGVRVEQNILDGEGDRVVPVFRTGINWQAAEYTFLRASFGQGYRYPSIAEKYATTTLGSVRIFPSPGVRAESGWSSEVGVMQGFLLGEIRGEGDLALFFSQNSDMIEYILIAQQNLATGLSGVGFKAINVEQSRIYGAETQIMLRGSFGFADLTITGGYTYIYPVEYNAYTGQNTDVVLKYRRKHTVKAGLQGVRDRFETGVDIYVRSKTLSIDDVFLIPLTREEILPGFYDYWQENNTGYFLMDISAGYRLSNTMKVSVAVKNVTNTEYMGRPGDVQPHRNFSLRLSGRF